MKFAAPNLSVLPGAQASQQRAPNRKGSDRDADFDAALAAQVIAGQPAGQAQEQHPRAKEAVDAKEHHVVPAARKQAAARPDGAAKAGGKAPHAGAAAGPRVPSAPDVAANAAPATQPGHAKENFHAKAPSAGEGMAHTVTPTPAPAQVPTPNAGPARGGVPLPPVFETSAAADTMGNSVTASQRPAVKRDAIGASTAGASATVPATSGAAATPASGVFATSVPPAEATATVRSGSERLRVPVPPTGGAAPQADAHRPEVTAVGSASLGLPTLVASNDDVQTATDRREAPQYILHPASREPRIEDLPLRPPPREAYSASSSAPTPALVGAMATNARPERIDEAGRDEPAPSFGSKGSVEVAPRDRGAADPPHLEPRVDPTLVSFAPPKEPQAASPTSPVVSPAARPAPIPQEHSTLAGLEAGLLLDASGAKLSVRDTRAGDLALDVRIQDGSLDIRAGGAAAPVMAANEAELRLALAGAGMRLGQLAVEASVEGRVPAATLAANTERRRSRDDERETKRIDGKEPREAGEEPASIHVKV